MKKLLCILLSVIMMFSTAVCVFAETEELTPPSTSSGEIKETPETPETPAPTTESTTAPTTESTTAPTTEPTTAPTTEPTTAPTTEPTTAPTTEPTTAPTTEPTTAPTTEPTTAPTTEPTTAPTTEPTTAPTTEPTTAPTTEPTLIEFTFVNLLGITIKTGSYESVEKALADAPENQTATKNNNDGTHTIDEIHWQHNEELGNVINAVIVNTQTVECSDFEVITVAPTCIAKGSETTKCKACGYISNTQELDELGHSFAYTVVDGSAPTCDKNGIVRATCQREGCDVSYDYAVPSAHQFKEWTLDKAPTCSQKGTEVSTCEICSITTEREIDFNPEAHTPGEATIENETPATCTENAFHEEVVYCTGCEAELSRNKVETPDTAGHKWVNNTILCKACGKKDKVTEILSFKGKTEYFVGDTEVKSYTLKVACENHTATVTTKSSVLGKIDTSAAGEKEYTVTYQGVKYSKPVTITVTTPKIVVKIGTESVYNNDLRSLGKSGLTFTATTNTGDTVKYTLGAKKYLSVTQSKNKFTVKPKSYFVVNFDNMNDFYVEFYFTRNGTKYARKIYLDYPATVTCSTSEKTYVQGAKAELTVKFTEAYPDGTKKTFKETVKLNTSSVGKKSYKSDFYGSAVPYYYYVKCKTPTLKATAQSKAVTLSWGKVSGATGYKIYRSTSKSGSYKAVKTISNGSTTSFKNTGLSSKKTYYYKIVALYSKTSKCNSSASAVVKCKTK